MHFNACYRQINKFGIQLAVMYLKPDNNNKPDSLVQEVQSMLNMIRTSYHHNWDYLTPDGRYGELSAIVVRRFQQYKGILSEMTPKGPVLGDTTINFIRQEFNSIPRISSASSDFVQRQYKTERSNRVNKPKVLFDVVSLLSVEGAPIYKKIEAAVPIAFKRLSKQSDSPMFVFSKQQAYHGGAKYARFNMPESISRYLSTVGMIWSWLLIKEEIDEYNKKRKMNNASNADSLKLGANIYTLCTSSMDTVLASPVGRQLAKKLAGRYAVAQTGAVVSMSTVTGVAALSAIGQCIGSFLLGWEIGRILGDIPIGDSRHVQDVIDDAINYVWDTPLNPMKKIIEWNVNRISNLKPLTIDEQRKLNQYLMQNREMEIYAAPPRFYFRANI